MDETTNRMLEIEQEISAALERYRQNQLAMIETIQDMARRVAQDGRFLSEQIKNIFPRKDELP